MQEHKRRNLRGDASSVARLPWRVEARLHALSWQLKRVKLPQAHVRLTQAVPLLKSLTLPLTFALTRSPFTLTLLTFTLTLDSELLHRVQRQRDDLKLARYDQFFVGQAPSHGIRSRGPLRGSGYIFALLQPT